MSTGEHRLGPSSPVTTLPQAVGPRPVLQPRDKTLCKASPERWAGEKQGWGTTPEPDSALGGKQHGPQHCRNHRYFPMFHKKWNLGNTIISYLVKKGS